jgi:hypothetical protein
VRARSLGRANSGVLLALRSVCASVRTSAVPAGRRAVKAPVGMSPDRAGIVDADELGCGETSSRPLDDPPAAAAPSCLAQSVRRPSSLPLGLSPRRSARPFPMLNARLRPALQYPGRSTLPRPLAA